MNIIANHFFLLATLIGITAEALLAFFLMKGAFMNTLASSKTNALIHLLLGAFCALALAHGLDKNAPFNSSSFFSTAILKPSSIFLFATIVGALANFLMQWKFSSDDFNSWFLMPLMWTVPVGVVLASVLGAICYFAASR